MNRRLAAETGLQNVDGRELAVVIARIPWPSGEARTVGGALRRLPQHSSDHSRLTLVTITIELLGEQRAITNGLLYVVPDRAL